MQKTDLIHPAQARSFNDLLRVDSSALSDRQIAGKWIDVMGTTLLRLARRQFPEDDVWAWDVQTHKTQRQVRLIRYQKAHPKTRVRGVFRIFLLVGDWPEVTFNSLFHVLDRDPLWKEPWFDDRPADTKEFLRRGSISDTRSVLAAGVEKLNEINSPK